MRIAEIASCGTPVRDGVGESVEQLLADLCERLIDRGHEVTLFATGDSQTRAELRWLFERGYDEMLDLWDWQFAEYNHVGHAYAEVAGGGFDLVHCHSYQYGLPFAPFVEIPNVHTHHVAMDPLVIEMYGRRPELEVVCASAYQASAYGALQRVSLIPHGIDTAAFPAGTGGGGYLLFVGRMIADKGPAEAVAIARAAELPLILAGPLEEHEGFEERVLPSVDGDRVRYVGRVTPAERNELLAGAAALVYPILVPEPFGLVLAEAQACGTPVLATRLGAVPELVEHGVSGLLADRWEELAALVPAVARLDRERIRARAVERFDVRHMVDLHEQLYERLLATHAGGVRP